MINKHFEDILQQIRNVNLTLGQMSDAEICQIAQMLKIEKDLNDKTKLQEAKQFAIHLENNLNVLKSTSGTIIKLIDEYHKLVAQDNK